VEWGAHDDLERARALHVKYRALRLGLVDGVVIAVAERLRAKAIATLDVRHFGAVTIRGRPKILPRDRGFR
jgi:predicted nucleic acid-binding protein